MKWVKRHQEFCVLQVHVGVEASFSVRSGGRSRPYKRWRFSCGLWCRTDIRSKFPGSLRISLSLTRGVYVQYTACKVSRRVLRPGRAGGGLYAPMRVLYLCASFPFLSASFLPAGFLDKRGVCGHSALRIYMSGVCSFPGSRLPVRLLLCVVSGVFFSPHSLWRARCL